MGKLLKRVKKGFSKEDVGYLRHCESAGKVSTLHFIIYHCLFAALVTHIINRYSIVNLFCNFFLEELMTAILKVSCFP